jgi:[ribosomal protein S5]-alanine N-acetyltransferase
MLDLTDAFATFPILETERLVLRAMTPEDADDMFRIYSDPEVMRYWGMEPFTSIDHVLQRVARSAEMFREQTGVRWAITRKGEGQVIGTCGHRRIIKEHHRSEIGYELARDAWGKGIMPEAVDAILRFGFERIGLHSVEALIDPANVGSRRVLEKLGFVQEGYFRESYYADGRFTDTAVFSLLKRDWAAQA